MTFKRLKFDLNALRAKMDAACQHPNARIVWTAYSSCGDRYYSGRQLRRFCDDCGWLLPNALKHTLATPDTPEISLEAVTRGSREAEEQREREQAEFAANREHRRAEYETYLQSDDWSERRALIMQRDRGVCQGCHKAPAQEVHHLTYENCGNEFLWELVAICRDCHRRLHETDEF
jgi:5-methylcytosine-specific restriction endonuclease McrA